MKFNYGLLLAFAFPLCLQAMNSEDRYDYLKDTKAVLRKMDNVFDPEPTDENAPLNEERLMNNFYRELKGKSPEEHQKTAKEILSLKFTDNGYALYRYHVAALVMAGIDSDTISDKNFNQTLLHNAALEDDYGLCLFLLQRKADPNKDSDCGPVLFNCKTVKIAQLMLDHGADPKVNRCHGETLLHQVAGRSMSYETELISLYRSRGVSVFSVDSHNGTAVYALASIVSDDFGVKAGDIKKRLDVLLQGLNPKEKRALLAVSQEHGGTVFQLLETQSQYDKKIGGTSDWVTKKEQKRNYLKTLLQQHLAEN